MANPKRFLVSGILIFLVVIFTTLSTLSGIYTDYLWFLALGFKTIFTVSLWAKVGMFFGSAILFALFAGINLLIASKLHSSKISKKMSAYIVLVISFFIGLYTSATWMKLLQYLNQTPFGIADPIFNKDVAFYVFTLPFYISMWQYLFAILLITTILISVYYLQNFFSSLVKPKEVDPHTNVVLKQSDFKKDLVSIKRAGMVHITLLGSMIFLLLSVKHYLARFSIMHSESGIVVGAGYTDVMVFIPIVKLLMILALVVAVVFLVWIFYFSKDKMLKKRHIIAFVLVVYVAFLFIGQTLVPGVVQSLKVTPNEINLEKEYIANNIHFTRMAYGLDAVHEEDFDVAQNITLDLLKQESQTIDNIRILDYRPLTQTYKQTQEIRLYYDLSGIDIDRYIIDGKYTQVMLAPRELDQTQITQNAQTWVNLHMVYTHGFGLVMSPVNTVTKQGLPNYLIKDIPPAYSIDKNNMNIDEPRIYYGEKDNNFVLVNTNTQEFDYPKGSTNKYISYDGTGGVTLDSFMKQLFMALRFGDIKILLSSDLTPDSKILFTRSIRKRISTLTPFLELDPDPYLVIDSGKLYWIQDAYTTTSNYPYSQKVSNINYIRNSVKIVVDAYNGDVTYYVMDMQDPLIQTYAKIFPDQFLTRDDMPESLKKHIRYPEELFKIQSLIYSTYHMDDTTVFYNKEDAWQIPYEIYGTGEKVLVDPYYIIMKIPGEDKEEFVLMTTFTPIKKDNMVAWMAARSDDSNYGKLILYKFPKDKLVYGPLQIEARIDQDSEISQQLTLWSQQGSRVTRGNLIVMPIGDSLLYIEPLYIQAEKGQLPELKRVFVSDGDSVVMEQDLETALKKLFGKTKTRLTEDKDGEIGISTFMTSDELIEEAGDYYDAILSAMESGDWTSFGDNFDALGIVLEELAE